VGNILTVPTSGIISFDSLPYANLEVQSLSSSSRIVYNNLGKITISSTSLSEERFGVEGINGQLLTVKDTLTGNAVNIVGNLNVTNDILSGGVNLKDSLTQTLNYTVSSNNLAITSGNIVSLSSLSFENITPNNSIKTIEEFAETTNDDINRGFAVTLYNGRVYVFAGTNKNNPNHYLEVNSNPYLPIYKEIPLSGNQMVIDSFYLGDFKSAKYTLQIETNFNNEIYYSEINVVGSVQTSTGVASEYGQIYTGELILGYDVNVYLNDLNLILLYGSSVVPEHKLIVKGHRTNLYRI
jgi:hypothetical protein